MSRLRNSPEAIKDRRELYDRLHRLLHDEVLRDLSPTIDQIGELHRIRHDCEFRFPDDIVAALRQLIADVVTLHSTRETMRYLQGMGGRSEEEWHALVERNHEAVTAVTSFEEGMTAMFKPYLSM